MHNNNSDSIFPLLLILLVYFLLLFSSLRHSYTAVAMPMLYNTRYSSRRRVTVMISVVWVLSFAISCPLLFGLNNTGETEICKCLCRLWKKIVLWCIDCTLECTYNTAKTALMEEKVHFKYSSTLCSPSQQLVTSPSVSSPILPSWCTPPSCPSMFPSSSPCWCTYKFTWSWGSAGNAWTPSPSSGSVKLLILTSPLRWRSVPAPHHTERMFLFSLGLTREGQSTLTVEKMSSDWI